MSADMRGRSWRAQASAAATSRLASFKGYLAQQDLKNSLSGVIQRQSDTSTDRDGSEKKQTWREWAGQKISRGYSNLGTEKVALFPGWAARRYNDNVKNTDSFEVDVYVSGFATVHRAPELASRSQRAFMRLARGYAALPKLESIDPRRQEDEEAMITTELSPSTEDLLKTVQLPPRPNEMSEQREVEMLERHFQRSKSQEGFMDSDDSSSTDHSWTSSVERNSSTTPGSSAASSFKNLNSVGAATAISEELLRKMHGNLDARLQPFWSSVIPGRTVRLQLFTSPDSSTNLVNDAPLAVKEVQTAPDGSFQTLFRIQWEDMCQHPTALHIAFGETLQEHEFVATAELSRPPGSSASSSLIDLRDAPTNVSAAASIRVNLTHSPIRVVSDVDDTVKHSNIPGVPGMGEWYSNMWKQGARFHYVSNGPFELLPVLGEFFPIARLPPGSIKLRSYAGRSLFSGLLSAPAAKKRSGVQEIIDCFPHSQFLLIGDTGEQDLELYAEIARDRPQQILAIFIRDAGSGDPLEDPTGQGVVDDQVAFDFPGSSMTDETPYHRKTATEDHGRKPPPIDTSYRIHTPRSSSYKTPSTSGSNAADFFTSSRITTEPESMENYSSSRNPSTTSLSLPFSRKTPNSAASGASKFPIRTPKSTTSSTSTTTSSNYPRLTEAEKKRYDLQMRVYRARIIIPQNVVLRVFRSPTECVEAETFFSS